MSESGNLSTIQSQFRRQAEVYSTMPVVTDPALLEFMVSVSGVAANEHVLDVASGPGYVALAFAPHCARVIGLDATDRLVARARVTAAERGITNVWFALGDVERMALRASGFELATCRFAFHHFPHPATVIAEMCRVTRPGGRMVIVDMLASEDQAKADYHNAMERLCDPSHARALPASEFERIFTEHGLEITFKQSRKTSYRVEDWIAHGAPPPENAAKIVAMMEASIEPDQSALDVRRQDGTLYFSHTGVSYVVRKRLS
ncbi:MAG: class I SAM-dependent methyltransferase [Candidatus Binataceae bacterium]